MPIYFLIFHNRILHTNSNYKILVTANFSKELNENRSLLLIGENERCNITIFKSVVCERFCKMLLAAK